MLGFIFRSISERRIIGKPQNLSRLRYIDIVEKSDETPEEKLYRQRYKQLQDWNNQYWAENNNLFNNEKANYIKKHFQEDALSHDQLAEFYRDFLERNRDKHIMYNRTWYKNHLTMLCFSIRAKLSRLKTNYLGQDKSSE